MQGITLVALSVLFFVQQSCAGDTGFKDYDGIDYYFGKNQTWSEADSYCKKKWGGRGNLARINGALENKWVYEQGGRKNTYIGASDRVKEGTFVWSDGYPLDFTNWQKGEPNDFKKREDCAHIWKGRGGKWNDINCGQRMRFVCKKHNVRLGPNGKEYYFGSKLSTWKEADDFCSKLWGGRGNLARISSAEENKWIYAQTGNRNTYIGANDRENERTFVWSDGHSLKYTNWQKGEPNDFKKNEDCAHIWKGRGGKWNDVNCDKKMAFVCKNDDSQRVAFGKLYHFEAALKTWSQAYNTCKKKWGGKGDLVRVESAAENKFLYRQAGKKNTYIGASDLIKEGTFVWSDGCPLKYKNWHKGEPNDFKKSEDCAHIWVGRNGTWNDINCGHKMGSICQHGKKC